MNSQTEVIDPNRFSSPVGANLRTIGRGRALLHAAPTSFDVEPELKIKGFVCANEGEGKTPVVGVLDRPRSCGLR